MFIVAGFRYRLHSEECDEVGEIATAVPNRSQSEEFTTGEGRRFTSGIIPVDDDVGSSTSL